MPKHYQKLPDDADKAMMALIEYLVRLDPQATSPEGILLVHLVTYRERYEKKHFPITPE